LRPWDSAAQRVVAESDLIDLINFRGDFKLAWQKLTRELKICDHSDKTDGYRGSNKEYTSHLKLAIYYSLFHPHLEKDSGCQCFT